jgi:hypothetical protein
VCLCPRVSCTHTHFCIFPPCLFLQSSDILETVDVSGDGGILKHVLKRGEGDVPPSGAQM